MAKTYTVTKKALAKVATKAIAANPPKIKLTSGQRRTITAGGNGRSA